MREDIRNRGLIQNCFKMESDKRGNELPFSQHFVFPLTIFLPLVLPVNVKCSAINTPQSRKRQSLNELQLPSFSSSANLKFGLIATTLLSLVTSVKIKIVCSPLSIYYSFPSYFITEGR